jgi:hypothetical protein
VTVIGVVLVLVQSWQAGGTADPANPANWAVLIDAFNEGASLTPEDVSRLLGPPADAQQGSESMLWTYRPRKQPGRVFFRGEPAQVSRIVPPSDIRGRF